MFQRIWIDRDVEVASQIEKRADCSSVQDSFCVEAFFFLMDGQDFAHKKVVVAVSSDVSQLAFEADIGVFENGRLDDFRRGESDLKFLHLIHVMT